MTILPKSYKRTGGRWPHFALHAVCRVLHASSCVLLAACSVCCVLHASRCDQRSTFVVIPKSRCLEDWGRRRYVVRAAGSCHLPFVTRGSAGGHRRGCRSGGYRPLSATTVGGTRCTELRFEHAPAPAAYRHDPYVMRCRLRTLLSAHGSLHTCRYTIPIYSMIGANGAVVAVPRGCALSSVQPCPSLRRVPAPKPGSEDHPERRDRRHARRCARPRLPTCARVASWEPAYAHTCLRL